MPSRESRFHDDNAHPTSLFSFRSLLLITWLPGSLHGAEPLAIENPRLVGSYSKVAMSMGEAVSMFPGKAYGQFKNFNGGGGVRMEHEKMLSFSVQNSAAKAAESFNVQFLVVGRDVKTGKANLLEKAETSVTLNPREKREITSKKVSTVHYLQQQSGASFGVKIVGHTIRVYQGSRILAESYSENDFKKLFDEAAE